MDNPAIVFYGTPDFAVASLRALVDAGMDVKAVVTAPDRPAGRGKKLKAPPVKTYAESQNIPVYQPTNLKDAGFIEKVKAIDPDIQVVVAFRMMPKALWEIPKLGTFNLHASLLPQYRGAAPINWAIINGETKTGNTTFLIDDKIDTGNILMQEEISITPDMNAGMLHDVLMEHGAELVVKTVKALVSADITPKPQEATGELKPAPKLFKETCKIDWQLNSKTIRNFIRGLSPYPGAWTQITNGNDAKLKIYKASISTSNLDAGTMLVKDKNLFIGTGDGSLRIEELQMPGKKRMQTQQLLNGTDLTEYKIIMS